MKKIGPLKTGRFGVITAMIIVMFAAGLVWPAAGMTPDEARAHLESAIATMKGRQAGLATNFSVGAGQGSGGDSGGGSNYKAMDAGLNGFPTNGFIITIRPTTNALTGEPEALLGLLNTTTNLYQLLSKSNLDRTVAPFWFPVQLIFDSNGTSQVTFDPIPIDTNDMAFFVGVSGDTMVSISKLADAFETNVDGLFAVDVNPAVDRDLTVAFRISGVASNGVDYVTISNTVTVPAGGTRKNIVIQPLDDDPLDFEEPVVLDLVFTSLTNGYVINPEAASACLTISDILPTNFLPVVTLDGGTAPIGIDYYAPSNSLLISQSFVFNAPGTNFAHLNSNGVLSTWTSVTGLLNEVKLATVKQTINGFTNGDAFFSSSNNIGWLSADGTKSNLAWCTLTNSVVTNAQFLRGSFYWDETGVWSNHLIVVTSDDLNDTNQLKEVWRVDAQGHPTLVAQIRTAHLEGVIVLTNDVQRWGPWAGKVITGDEVETNIYAIDTNGVATRYPTLPIYPCGGISAEDFDIIKTNQDLYACDPGTQQIVKLPRSLLAGYVGDLLITQAAEHGHTPRLFIVHWDGASFIARAITYQRPDLVGLPPGSLGLEHVTFAPIDIPIQTQ
jgi:hypothetical protein